MTTAPFVSPSPSRVSSVPASLVSKTLGRPRAGVAFPTRPCDFLLRLRSPVMVAAGVGGNGSPVASVSSRTGEVKRVTKETNVHVKINLDGTGVADCSTGIPFLDHMLDALLQALGDRKGINQFRHFTAPLDAAAEVILEMLSYKVIFDLPRYHEHVRDRKIKLEYLLLI